MRKHLTDNIIETLTDWIKQYVRYLDLSLGDSVQFGPNYIYIEIQTWEHEMKMRIPYPDFILPADDHDAAVAVMEHIQLFFTKALVEKFLH